MRIHVTLPCVAALMLAAAAHADTTTITTSKDNTLYFPLIGPTSNGAGEFVYAGASGAGPRRALLAFDIAAAVPAGATIDSVSLTLHLSRFSLFSDGNDITLHRVLADWGEGTSDAGDPGGFGATPTPGDATWDHRFYDDVFWTTPGGDFDPTVSGNTFVDVVLGHYTWSSTPQMVADVQNWLDNPSSSFGWLLMGDEGTPNSAKRFDSRENIVPAYRPQLVIEYTPIPEPAGLTVLALLLIRRRGRS